MDSFIPQQSMHYKAGWYYGLLYLPRNRGQNEFSALSKVRPLAQALKQK